MKVKKAIQFYQSLSKDQQKFINEKQISLTLPIREWIAFLKNAALYDEIGDATRKKNITKIVASVVCIIASVFITLWIPLVGILLIVVAVLVMAETIRVNSKLIHLDLTNHLRIFLMPLLYILVSKAGEKADLALSLDLRNPIKKDPNKRYKEFESDIKLFEPRYIIGKLKLLDQTTMDFMLSDDIRSMRIVRRNMGKTKIKHKDKVARYYYIRLTFPKSFYMVKNGSHESVKLEETADSIICKLKAKSKTEKIEAIVSVNEFLKSVEELYGLVTVKPGAQLPEQVNLNPLAESAPAGQPMPAATPDILSMLPFMVWGGSYFGTADYSGFSRERGFLSDDFTHDTFLDS